MTKGQTALLAAQAIGGLPSAYVGKRDRDSRTPEESALRIAEAEAKRARRAARGW